MSSRVHHVLVLLGGASGEHSISIRSAATVVHALLRAGHRVTCVGITQAGDWLLGDFSDLLARARDELVSVESTAGSPVTLARAGASRAHVVAIAATGRRLQVDPIDVVFPVLHGPHGEDGTIQGFLEVIGVPYVGAGCAASVMAMDKLCMKTLCAGVGIPQTDFLAAEADDAGRLTARVEATFGFPCFVKPANLGSSVGISRALTPPDLPAALAEARRWDTRVLVERAVDARELEIAILGNECPALSPIGEIITRTGFYDFQSKYVADDSRLAVPADLEASHVDAIRSIAREVWELIGCRGMARADFFLDRSSGHVLFNELNTIPGFTPISMYPRLWEAAGLEIETLVDNLLCLTMGETVALPR